MNNNEVVIVKIGMHISTINSLMFLNIPHLYEKNIDCYLSPKMHPLLFNKLTQWQQNFKT